MADKFDILNQVEGVVADRNLLSGSTFERGVAADWVPYADAAGSLPVDGTGGSPSVTVAIDSTGINSSSLKFIKPASNVQGEGISKTFTVKSGKSGRSHVFKCDYKIKSGTYADNDVIFYLYDITNSTLIEPVPFRIENHSLTSKTFQFEFQSTYSASDVNYRLIIHVASTSASAFELEFDDMALGTFAKSYASMVGNFKDAILGPIVGSTSGTFSIGTGGGATYSAQYKQISDEAIVKYTVRIGTSGVSDIVGAYVFPFPTGLTPAPAANSYEILGYGDITQISTANPLNRLIAKTLGSGFVLDSSDANLLGAGGNLVNNGNILNVTIRFKVAGWSTSQVSSVDNGGRNVFVKLFKVSQSIASQGAEGSEVKVTSYDTIAKDSTGLVDAPNSQIIVKESGYYFLGACAEIAAAVSGAKMLKIFKNGLSLDERFARSDTAVNTTISGLKGFDLNAGDIIDLRIFQNSGSALTFSSITLELMKFNGNQQILASEKVICSYKTTSGQSIVNTGTTVIWNTKIIDTHSAMNTSTGEFTAPRADNYFAAVSNAPTVTGAMDVNLFYNGSQVSSGRNQHSTAPPVPKTEFIGYLLAGQKISNTAFGITGNLNTDGAQNTISIFSVGGQ